MRGDVLSRRERRCYNRVAAAPQDGFTLPGAQRISEEGRLAHAMGGDSHRRAACAGPLGQDRRRTTVEASFNPTRTGRVRESSQIGN